jgi:hypothetical protein
MLCRSDSTARVPVPKPGTVTVAAGRISSGWNAIGSFRTGLSVHASGCTWVALAGEKAWKKSGQADAKNHNTSITLQVDDKWRSGSNNEGGGPIPGRPRSAQV